VFTERATALLLPPGRALVITATTALEALLVSTPADPGGEPVLRGPSDVQVLADDFNNDGKTDLALINQAAGWTSVPVALSGPTGFPTENVPASGFASLAANPNLITHHPQP